MTLFWPYILHRSCNNANDCSTSSQTNKLLHDLKVTTLWNRVHFEEELRRCQSDPWFARDYCSRYCDSYPPGGCPSEACKPSRNNASNIANSVTWSGGESSFLKTDSGGHDNDYRWVGRGAPYSMMISPLCRKTITSLDSTD